MKARDSGMPEEGVWEGFFDPARVLSSLGLTLACRDVVEFGCGYGTFTIPAARGVTGRVYAFDIEHEMIARTRARATAAGLENICAACRDILETGTGLPDESVDYAMVFNILHAEEPLRLLREAARVLRGGGRLGIIHWIPDPSTPRGPALDIRPTPQQCLDWTREAGFTPLTPLPIPLPPFHYGLSLEKRDLSS